LYSNTSISFKSDYWIERWRWDSNLEAIVRGLYYLIINLDITKIPRATTSFYNVTVPSDAVRGLFDFGPPGTSRGISDGYSLFLAPLPVGKHVIEFKVVDHLSGPTSEPIIREGKYTVFIK
jgi:hypothetical protein